MKLDKAIILPINEAVVNVAIVVRDDDGSFAGRVEAPSLNTEEAIKMTKQQLRHKAKELYEEKNQ